MVARPRVSSGLRRVDAARIIGIESKEETPMSLKMNTAAAGSHAVARLLSGALVAVGLLGGNAVAADLVTTRIDTARRAALPGHQVAWARAANDRGAVSAASELRSLTLGLKRSPERQLAFDAYLREQRDPTSPNYQRWLTPSQVGERFGATQADIDAISGWLRDQGLSVESVSNSRMSIRFSGTAAAVGSAFGTQLRYYGAAGTAKRMAPATEPQIPVALANAVSGVIGLSDVRFEPQNRFGRLGTLPAGGARPALTNCQGSDCSYFVTPGDFAKIYGLEGPMAQGLDGTGQSIAILGRARVYDADIQAFGARVNVAMKTPIVIVPPDGADPGPAVTTCSDTEPGAQSCTNPSDLVQDQSEATLDVTRAGSVAPGADIKLIVSGRKDNVDGVFHALIYSIDHEPLAAQVISISFGSCEANNTPELVNALDKAFAQAAVQGQSVLVASGDAGAADCAKYFTQPTAGLSRSTNIFCSSGHVTCVGGTSFGLGTDNAQYWSQTNRTGYASAKGYIPEGAWNEPLDHDGKPYVAATGGGVSAHLPTPSWQTAPGVPGTEGRYVPDVSFGASTRNGYFGCMAASQASCVPGSDNRFHFLIWGGTSASAPSMAGVAAMLNQSRGAAQGNLNPTLYALGANPANGVFHDVTVQSSGVTDCSAGTASLCNNTLPSPTSLTGGVKGYLVGPGYDLATGLGSMDVGKLLANWAGAPIGINPDQQGVTGAWADLSTSSQGIVLEVFQDLLGSGKGQLFGGWFTFDTTAAGGQRWYTLQGAVDQSSPISTIPIVNTTGGRFNTGQATQNTEVGTALLRFADCGHATLDYLFTDGSNRSGTLDLTRLTVPTACSSAGDASAAGSDYLLSGTWADPGDNGQGLVVDINPQQKSFFAAWYTFAGNGPAGGNAASQRWFTLQAGFQPGNRHLATVPIYVSSGGVFDQSSNTTTTQVGSADIRFLSCNSATLTYTFPSGSGFKSSGTLNLSRVGPVPKGCTF